MDSRLGALEWSIYTLFVLASWYWRYRGETTQSSSIYVTIICYCVLKPLKTCWSMKFCPSCITRDAHIRPDYRDAHNIITFISAIPALPRSLTPRLSALRSSLSTSPKEYLLFTNRSFLKPLSVPFVTYLLRKLTSSPLSARTEGTTSAYYLVIHHNRIGIRRLVHPYGWKYSNLHLIFD